MKEAIRGSQGDLVVQLSAKVRLEKGQGALARKKRTRHAQTKDEDDGVAVLFLWVYAVYDEGFEKDGAVL